MVSAPHRADAAGRAFPAAFDGAEFEGKAGHLGHVYGVVEGDNAAMAEHQPFSGKAFVVHGQVQHVSAGIGP